MSLRTPERYPMKRRAVLIICTGFSPIIRRIPETAPLMASESDFLSGNSGVC